MQWTQDTVMLASEVTIEVPWGRIAGKVWGSLNAPPILCVHGIQDNANSFDHLIPLLPSAFCYVAIDLPGHGQSSHFPAGGLYSYVDYCLSLVRVVDHFGWKSFMFIGHSLGGQLGYLYTSFYPDQVTKLVVFDSIIPYRRSKLGLANFFTNLHENLIKLEKSMASKVPPSYTEEEALRRLTDGRPTPLTQAAARALFSRGVTKSGDGYAFSADQRLKLSIPSFFSKDEVFALCRKIKCPIFVVRASETQIFVEAGATYDNQGFENLFRATLGDNYHYRIVEGSHDVHLLHPERFANEVYNFLLKPKSSL